MPFECRREGWRWWWCWWWWQKGVSCKWRQHKFLLSIEGQQAGSRSCRRRRVGVEIEKTKCKEEKKKRKKNWKAKEKRSEENRNTKKNRSRGRNCCWLSMGVREEMEEEGGECPGGSARQKIMTIFPPQMSAKSDSRQGVEATRRKEQPRIQDPGPLLALSVLTRIKDISATTTRRENSMENCRATQLEKMTKFIKKRREKKISRKRKKNRSRKTDKGGEGQRRE